MFKMILITMVLTVFALADGPILQTGQVKSYDADGTVVTDGSVKDDGHYQVGKTRSYSRSGDVVTDNVTGLEWQDNETVQRPWLTQENYDAGNYNDTSGITATTYCSDLTLADGGWRLPTIEELETLVDDGKYNPSVTENVFQHISSDSYWSSTTAANPTSCAWLVYFYYGYSSNGYKSSDYYVRCVRGGQFGHLTCPEGQHLIQGERVCIPGTLVPNPGIWLPSCESGRLTQGQDTGTCDDTATPVGPPGLFLPVCPDGE